MDGTWMVLGFVVAAYSTVANDSIQTLGTFLASNARRPWWMLWLFASSILAAVVLYGWWANGGDPAWGRLGKIPLPTEFSWIYVVPPIALVALTRLGLPVSTTFLILTVFSPKSLGDMLLKSLAGYGVAFLSAVALYLLVSSTLEKRWLDTADEPVHPGWTVAQWCSTAFLWSQWLIQDAANVFVFLPRQLELWEVLLGVGAISLMQAYTFYELGGSIQKVVTSKTNTQDIRSATVVDFLYACVLWVFKGWSQIPMSTTWVFLGLLAGRELAIHLRLRNRDARGLASLIGADLGKATIGLAVSVALALGLPWLAGTSTGVGSAAPTTTAAAYPKAP